VLTKYYEFDHIKGDESGGACVGEMRNTYWVIVGKPEGRRQLGRHGQNRENNIKWILNIIGGYGLDSAG